MQGSIAIARWSAKNVLCGSHPGCVSRCAFGCVRRCAFRDADGKVRSCVRGALGVRSVFLLGSGRVRDSAFGNAPSSYRSTGRVRDPTKVLNMRMMATVHGESPSWMALLSVATSAFVVLRLAFRFVWWMGYQRRSLSEA